MKVGQSTSYRSSKVAFLLLSSLAAQPQYTKQLADARGVTDGIVTQQLAPMIRDGLIHVKQRMGVVKIYELDEPGIVKLLLNELAEDFKDNKALSKELVVSGESPRVQKFLFWIFKQILTNGKDYKNIDDALHAFNIDFYRMVLFFELGQLDSKTKKLTAPVPLTRLRELLIEDIKGRQGPFLESLRKAVEFPNG